MPFSATAFFNKYKFIGVLFLPLFIYSCEKALHLKDKAISPGAVYEDVWQALDKNYALFPVKNVNWDSVHAQTQSQFTNDLNNTELFKKIGSMLEVLKDGHITLISPEKTYTYDKFYSQYPANFNFLNIEKNYLKNQYTKSGPIIYKVVDSVAYLYYASFHDNISEDNLNTFFSGIAGAKGLIIDVRNNRGGNLSNAEKLFSRFINSTKLVKYEVNKKGPGHNNFFDKEAIYISPTGNYYNKPVVLLTNRACFSACNDFVMYMSYLPNVTIAGDQTGGGGAIPADYILLNGWKLQYSSSLTLSPDNLPIENGIQPDVAISITPSQELNGIDPILEKAYFMIR